MKGATQIPTELMFEVFYIFLED